MEAMEILVTHEWIKKGACAYGSLVFFIKLLEQGLENC
jgi:ribonuclease I